MDAHDDVQAELPLDGRIVNTRAGTWTVKVRRLFKEDSHPIRTAELTLVGTPSYGLTLKIPGTMLVADHKQGDIDWVLRAIGDWLVYPDPKNANSELIFQPHRNPNG